MKDPRGSSGPQLGTTRNHPEPTRNQSGTSPASPGWFRVDSGLVPGLFRDGSGLGPGEPGTKAGTRGPRGPLTETWAL